MLSSASQVGEVASQQDTGAHVLRHQLQLLAENLDHALPEVLGFLFPSQPFQGVE